MTEFSLPGGGSKVAQPSHYTPSQLERLREAKEAPAAQPQRPPTPGAADAYEGTTVKGHMPTGHRGHAQAYAISADGTPRFSKADMPLGQEMGTNAQLAKLGTATGAAAMALSKISGQVVEPGLLQARLQGAGGYAGGQVDWQKAAELVGLSAQTGTLDWNTLDAELAAGRPVVVPGDFAEGESAAHHLTLTRRDGNVYYANEPLSGQEVQLKEVDNQLCGEIGGKTFKSENAFIYFKGGNPQPGLAAPARAWGGP